MTQVLSPNFLCIARGFAARSVLIAMVACIAISETNGDLITILSNATEFRESTTFIDMNTNDEPWPGVGALPASSTFTIVPTIGGFANTIDNVPGTQNVLGQRGIRYFKATFNLPSFATLTSDFQLSFDNDIQIFVNSVPLALEGSGFGAAENFSGGVHHRLFVGPGGNVTNGHLGGDPFDSFLANLPPSTWNVGPNDVVLALRNASPPVQSGDLGGFSFRMDVTTAVPEPTSFALLCASLVPITARRHRR